MAELSLDGAIAVQELHHQQKDSSRLAPGEDTVQGLSSKFGVPLEVAAAIFQAGVERGAATARVRGGSTGANAACPSGDTAAAAAPTAGAAAAPMAAATVGAAVPHIGFNFTAGVSLEDLRHEQALFAKARDWYLFLWCFAPRFCLLLLPAFGRRL